MYTAEQELSAEKLRQVLCSMREFEPYAAFKRIDRGNVGLVEKRALCQFMRENGFRELEPEDFGSLIRYFDLDGDRKLNYHDFLQILLPCDDAYLRAAATQRSNADLPRCEFLPMRVERALSQLLYKEVRYQLRVDQMKRALENAYDFTFRKAFAAIDDWSYQYIDQSNLKRFLRSTGHVATQHELVSILRRFDMDGDAKINFKEFEVGLKSSLSTYGTRRKARPKSGSTVQRVKARIPPTFNSTRSQLQKSESKLQRSASARSLTPRRPARQCSRRGSASRRRDEQLSDAHSRLLSGPSSSYYLGGAPGGGPSLAAQDSPSRGNKSVSFNKAVKVREYPSSKKKSLRNSGVFDELPHRADAAPARHARPPQEQQPPLPLQYQSRASEYAARGGSPMRTSPRRHDTHPQPLSQSSQNRLQADFARDNFSPVQPPQARAPAGFDRQEQSELATVLKDIVFLERDVESAKIDLALKADFNLLDAFRMFDLKAFSFVSADDLAYGLAHALNFTEFSPDDVYLFVRRADASGRGRITFHEFSEALLPFSPEYAGLVTDRPDFYIRRGADAAHFFNCDTRAEFQNVWRTVLRAERAVEALRAQLKARPYFTIRGAFEFIDRDGDGFVRGCDLRELLADHGFYATERELAGLVHRLDRDRDNRISLAEFSEQLTPKLSR